MTLTEYTPEDPLAHVVASAVVEAERAAARGDRAAASACVRIARAAAPGLAALALADAEGLHAVVGGA